MPFFLIGPENTFGLLLALFGLVALGVVGERRGWYGRVSGVIVTIGAGSLLATLNVIPPAGNREMAVPVYDWIFAYIVPLSIPLFLFNSNFKRIFKTAGRLSGVFLLGAFGVALGSAIATWLIPFGEEGHQLAGVYTATYIGGSANFLAVAQALAFTESQTFQAAVAVDAVLTNFFILLLFYLPSWALLARWYGEPLRHAPAELPTGSTVLPKLEDRGAAVNMRLLESITLCLVITTAVCYAGSLLAPPLQKWLGTDIQLEIVVITALMLLLTNVRPHWFEPLEETAFVLGYLLAFLFLGVIGAASDIKEILVTTPWLVIYVLVIMVVHLIVMLAGGKLLGASLAEIAIGSAANIGGGTVSAPMAASFGLKGMVTPAILIGILGSAIGTFAGVAVGILLR